MTKPGKLFRLLTRGGEKAGAAPYFIKLRRAEPSFLPDDLKITIKSEDWSSIPDIDAGFEAPKDAIIKK